MTAGTGATSWCDGAQDLWDELWRAKAGDALAPVTIVTPTTWAALSTRRALALAARGRARPGISNVRCTSFDLLARRLAEPVLARRGLLPVPVVVEAEAVRQVAAGEERWARLVAHPRTFEMLRLAFCELRCLPQPALESLSRCPARGAEVAALLVAVRRRLHELGFADDLDVSRAALVALEDHDTATGTGGLLFLDPPHLGPRDLALVDALSRLRPHRTMRPPPDRAATERWSCVDPEEEARAAVRMVLSAAEDGVALWHQAILHPPGPGYARLLHQHLAASAVAAHGPGTRRLDRTSAGGALLGLLELAGGDWPRQQVLSWLSSAPLRTGPGGRPVPVSRWNSLSAESGVVRGRSQWRDRLGRFAARQPAEADEALALAAFVEELDESTALPGRSWTELTRWAEGLLRRYLDLDDATASPAQEHTAVTAVVEAVRSLADLDVLSAAPDLRGFRRALGAELGRRRLETAGPASEGFGDGVFVAPFAQARGMRLHTTVVVGLADRRVPGAATDDPLLPDELRQLDPSGSLATGARRRERMLTDARAALGAGALRRVVTFPAVDPRTGRPEAPSPLFGTLAGGTPVRRIDSLGASLRLPGPALSLKEHALRALQEWADGNRDMTDCPPVQFDARLRVGFEVRRARRGRSFTRFDGLTGAGKVTPFDPERPVSATRLETYAECPRKFLFERVLHVHERTLPEDLWRIEARHRGSLVHAVLEQYVKERISGAPRSLERLLAIADQHLDEAAAGGLVGKALLWRLDRAAIRRDLHTFHAEEGDLSPLAAEMTFGEDDAPAVQVTLADGRQVYFRGRADRVDRAVNGQLVVSDYKTGRQTGLSRLGADPLAGGRRLQLPLYALAARQLFGAAGPVVARYWMVSAERALAFFELELTESLERHFADMVGRIARAIDQGCFPAIPGAPRLGGFERCSWCDFDRVCPARRDRQWAAKRAAPTLAAVDDLLAGDLGEPLSATLVRSPGPVAGCGA